MKRMTPMTMQRVYRGSSQGVLATLFLSMLAISGVAWVSRGMITQEQWPVKWLEVDGAFERVSAEQIRASLVPVSAGSYFTVDMDSIHEAAYRQPWVESITVQKIWPDTVKVQIIEFMPAAHWTGDRLISNSGEMFEVIGAKDIFNINS